MSLRTTHPSAWISLAALFKVSRGAVSHALLACSLSLVLAGCNPLEKEQGPAPIVLHLTLNDSLAKYDIITVNVTSAHDTAKILEPIYSGKLPDPPVFPARTLNNVQDPFLVKVRGFRSSDQLALETLIYFEGGKKRVVQTVIPPLTPLNLLTRLNPTPGVLDPPFSASIANYTLAVPATASSISWDVKAAYINAAVTLNGQEIKYNDPPKEVPLPKATFVMPIMVTDLGVTRTYYVTVSPPKALRIELDSVVFSSGTLDPPFRPDLDFFTLTIPAANPSVDIQFWPTDPANMSLLVMAKPYFAGTKHPVSLASPGASTVVTVQVEKGDEFKDYTFIVRRAQ